MKCLTLGPHPQMLLVFPEMAALPAQFSHLSASLSGSFCSHLWAGPGFDLYFLLFSLPTIQWFSTLAAH